MNVAHNSTMLRAGGFVSFWLVVFLVCLGVAFYFLNEW